MLPMQHLPILKICSCPCQAGPNAPGLFLCFLRHVIMRIAKITRHLPHEFDKFVENTAIRRKNDCVLYIFCRAYCKNPNDIPRN